MRLTRDDIEMAVTIAEEGTLTAAARRLHLSQSALSHHLKGLEERVGAPLFVRLPRRMTPTAVGEELVRRGSLIRTEFHQLELDLETMAQGAGQVIRLGTQCYTSYHWLPSLVRRYSSSGQRVRLRIVPEATQRVVDALIRREIDFAILSSEEQDDRLHYWPLLQDELVLAVAEDHPLRRRRKILPEDLRSESLLIHATPDARHVLVDGLLAGHGVRPREVIRLQLTEAILEMAAAGMGVAAAVRWMIESAAKTRGLTLIPFGPQPVIRRWRCAVLRDSARHREFGDLAASLKSLLASRNQPQLIGIEARKKAG
ncbi:MAG TPA: LysR family transcriptional regulator [Blastocatellia bacterium]|nr:LysR family transcriptional regulator [Blastocatellia bacterium]